VLPVLPEDVTTDLGVGLRAPKLPTGPPPLG